MSRLFLFPRDLHVAHNVGPEGPDMGDGQDSLERAIAGALRATIRDHGAITPEHIGSATKRIIGNLRNARIDGIAREMARRRWADVSDEDRSKHQAAAAKARWSEMTKAERSAEMSRRRRLGAKNAARERKRME